MGSITEFLDALAEPRPDPGGGAASAVMLASGVALAQMVAGYSPDLVATEPALPARLARLREAAMSMVAADARVSAGFAAALSLPEQHPGRPGAVVAACLDAAQSALAIADLAVALLDDLRVLDVHGERRVHADVQVAAAAAGAALRASAANVRACVAPARGSGAAPADLERLAEVESRLATLVAAMALADRLSG